MALNCKLTTPELQERKRTVIASLKDRILSRRETSSGFRFRFRGDDDTLDLLNAFIKTERQCCDFFNFDLLITSDGFAELELSGPEGAKTFIADEMGL